MRNDDVQLALEPEDGASGRIFNRFIFFREAPRPVQRRKQFFRQYPAFKLVLDFEPMVTSER
jgi:hypothetical protein